MSNTKFFLLLFIIIFLLNSCVLGSETSGVFNDEARRADAVMEQVIETIKNQDKVALSGMFSEKALIEADDFDENLDHLFELFDGNILSWESFGGLYVSGSISYGKKEVNSSFFVYTQNEKYFFLLEDCPINNEEPENVGFKLLLAMKVEKDEDRLKIWNPEQKILVDGDTHLERYGIYIPFE